MQYGLLRDLGILMSQKREQESRKIAGISPHRRNAVCAEFVTPADKSLTHRAVMFACIAKGKSTIFEPLLGADCQSTIAAFQQLGCKILQSEPGDKSCLKISSPGIAGFSNPTAPLNFGNSGTTARLMTGLLSSISHLTVSVFGDESLSVRPMSRVVDPLLQMGAAISGPSNGKFLPLTIKGTVLRAGSYEIDKASAQVKSALLLAGMGTSGVMTIRLPSGARDHTELLLLKLGAAIVVRQVDGIEEIQFTGPFDPPPIALEIPGDPSSAAFFAVLAAVLPGAKIRLNKVLVNPTRTGYFSVLRRMGVVIKERGLVNPNLMEACADVEFIGPQALSPVTILSHEIPTLIDEIPILAVAALYALGESRFCGLGELRVKESDRLTATQNLILAAGGKAEILGDDLIITGQKMLRENITIDSLGDHRLAMAAGILAKTLRGESLIEGSAWVDVSFPGFFDTLNSIG
jgi:3-phosphoshikimate 1-carboxyvinyltransferase